MTVTAGVLAFSPQPEADVATRTPALSLLQSTASDTAAPSTATPAPTTNLTIWQIIIRSLENGWEEIKQVIFGILGVHYVPQITEDSAALPALM